MLDEENLPTELTTHDAKKAIKMTLGFSKIDCHIDFFAS
jgi:hypothetical protein